MSYDIFWYLDKRIIDLTFHETLLLDEIPDMFAVVEQYREPGEDPVHLLVDLHIWKRFPSHWLRFARYPL